MTLAPTSVASADVNDTKLISTISNANVINPPIRPTLSKTHNVPNPYVPEKENQKSWKDTQRWKIILNKISIYI